MNGEMAHPFERILAPGPDAAECRASRRSFFARVAAAAAGALTLLPGREAAAQFFYAGPSRPTTMALGEEGGVSDALVARTGGGVPTRLA